MALLDPFNPRSVAFQVNRIDEGIGTLPVLRSDGMLEEPRRLTTLLRAELTTERAELLDDSRILAIEQRLLIVGKCHRGSLLPPRSRSGPSGESDGPASDLRDHAPDALYVRRDRRAHDSGACDSRRDPMTGRMSNGSASLPIRPRSLLTERVDPFGNRSPVYASRSPIDGWRSPPHHAFGSSAVLRADAKPAWESRRRRSGRRHLSCSRLSRDCTLSVSSRFTV